MNRKKGILIICSIGFIFAIIPLIVGIGISAPILGQITIDNNWIGFWGSYLGAVIGGIITLYVLQSTLKSNENARKRDEKIQFLNKIVNLYSMLSASVGNIFVLAMRLIRLTEDEASSNNELYRLYNQQINNAMGINTELVILLKTRQDIYDCKKFDDCLEDIAIKVNNFAQKFDEEKSRKFRNEDENCKLQDDMDHILNEISDLDEVLVGCIESNLHKNN